MSIRDIISDEDVKRVHANANFGDMTPRHVVNEGVVKAAFGYHMGSTVIAILREHNLIGVDRWRNPRLTMFGKRYLKVLLALRASEIIDMIAKDAK